MVFLARILRGAGPMGAEAAKSASTTRTGLTAGGINPRNLKFEISEASTARSVFELFVVVPAIFALAHFLTEDEFHRTARFRDKSALYSGINPDPENNPSWGPKTPYPNHQAKFDF